LNRERELLAKSANQGVEERHPASLPADEADQAVQSLHDEMDLHVAQLRAGEMQQIHAALQKVFEGTYGLCEWCGKKIPEKRLELLPEATLCVECQSERERESASDPFAPEWERVESAGTEASHERLAGSIAGSKF